MAGQKTLKNRLTLYLTSGILESDSNVEAGWFAEDATYLHQFPDSTCRSSFLTVSDALALR